MLVFTVRFAQKAALILIIKVSGIATQQIVYSPDQESILYHDSYPWHMHNHWLIEVWDVENVHTHTWMHTFHFITINSFRVTRWHRWHSRERRRSKQRCLWLVRRCARSLTPPACLKILWCASLVWKAVILMILIMHCQVPFYRSCHLFVPRKLNFLRLLLSDFGVRLID